MVRLVRQTVVLIETGPWDEFHKKIGYIVCYSVAEYERRKIGNFAITVAQADTQN